VARGRFRVLRVLVTLCVVGALLAAAGGIALYFALLRDLPDLAPLEDYRPALTSVVVDRDGQPIGEFYEHRRRITPLEELPNHLVQAFIAAEDDTFYEHAGVDYVSILRAAWANLRAGGETRQGASTITQQMVKQLLLTPERTYRRKLREMILARRIEQRVSKEQILFLYLNEIYFGAGAYGVGEAARTYFAKDVRTISVSEGALLAGLPKAPGRNSPYRNPERAEARRRYVIERLSEEGYIDPDTREAALAEIPELAAPPGESDFDVAAYFVEQVRRALVEKLGNETVLRGGLTVETTLDLKLQRAAMASVRGGLEDLDRRQGYSGPVRRIADDDREAELARLAEQNDLLSEDGELLAEFPEHESLLGMVVAVDKRASRARVAFAPGFFGTVALEEVSWARPRDLKTRAREVTDITEVFATGDVAHFRPAVAGDDSGEEELRVTLVQKPEAQAALLSFDVASGEVLAMVGGYDFAGSEFNRATQALRQPGSAFKPLIYAAALHHGYTPASVLYDRPVVYEDKTTGFVWRPENYGRRFLGPLTMSEALARSVNNATLHLLRDVGVSKVIRFARRLGIESPLTKDLSLALGSSPVTLLELTRAYGVLASSGRRVTPRFVRRVTDRDGEVLLQDLELAAEASATPSDPGADETVSFAGEDGEDESVAEDGDRLLTAQEAYLGARLVRSVVDHPRGTGRRARSLGRPLAGKTGTTNDQGDAWFIGFSPEVVTGVWVGFDSKKVLGVAETGGRAALPIWLEYMKAALSDRPVRDFPIPSGIVFARVDGKTGELADSGSETTSFLAFIAGTEPTRNRDSGTTTAEDRRRLRSDF
jgi:penicillin-binding protein 1A